MLKTNGVVCHTFEGDYLRTGLKSFMRMFPPAHICQKLMLLTHKTSPMF